MSTSKASRLRSGIAFGLSVFVIVAAGWLYLNRQYVVDQLTVWNYTPTSEVLALNDKVKFTDKGLFTFYATKPAVANSSEFNGKCPRQEAGSPILGCYTDSDRIYVFNIDNPQLDGIKEVTAAHEMLHAAWQRMDETERTRVGNLLNAAYEKSATPELKERMAYYQRNEPTALTNELHSILGTEVSNLGSELETYYQQYFQNRQLILDLHAKYNNVYQGLYSRADQLYTQMQTLTDSIETRSTQYDIDVANLSTDIDRFNSKAATGDFDSPSQFNNERAELVQRSATLDAERASINDDIATYGRYYDEYQQLATQIEGLNNSVDSFKTLEAAPTV
jgi:hypothetical protein